MVGVLLAHSNHPVPKLEQYDLDQLPDPTLQEQAALINAQRIAVDDRQPPTRRRLTKSERAHIVELYAEYQSTRKVAKAVGCARTTVLNVLKASGAEIREPLRPTPQETLQRVIALYKTGLTVPEVAEHLGISRNAVTAALKDAGAMRPQGRKSSSHLVG